jgi:hypothetical protein
MELLVWLLDFWSSGVVFFLCALCKLVSPANVSVMCTPNIWFQ